MTGKSIVLYRITWCQILVRYTTGSSVSSWDVTTKRKLWLWCPRHTLFSQHCPHNTACATITVKVIEWAYLHARVLFGELETQDSQATKMWFEYVLDSCCCCFLNPCLLSCGAGALWWTLLATCYFAVCTFSFRCVNSLQWSRLARGRRRLLKAMRRCYSDVRFLPDSISSLCPLLEGTCRQILVQTSSCVQCTSALLSFPFLLLGGIWCCIDALDSCGSDSTLPCVILRSKAPLARSL